MISFPGAQWRRDIAPVDPRAADAADPPRQGNNSVRGPRGPLTLLLLTGRIGSGPVVHRRRPPRPPGSVPAT